jgi:hypothetical protein
MNILIAFVILLATFITFYIGCGLLGLAEYLQTKKLPSHLFGDCSSANNCSKDYNDKKDYSEKPSQKPAQILGYANSTTITEDIQDTKNCRYGRYYGEYIYDIPFSHIASLLQFLRGIIRRLATKCK